MARCFVLSIFIQYMYSRLPDFEQPSHAFMSCPIHDHCTCYSTSLPYMVPMTAPGSSHLASHMNNIFVGYEWAAPLVMTSTAWYSLESAVMQPPTSHSGQELRVFSKGLHTHP
ncbi:hypothetical protein BC827DRAFT_1284015, partial [Russula dissimulans]